ncbi:MAG: Uma2 family endonuclease, partial [Verrucomicrobiota bacterium]
MSAAAAIAIEEPEEELLTLEDFAQLDLGEVADLVDGKVVLMGNNNPDHSEILLNMGEPLRAFVREAKLGKAYGGDVTVLVRRGPDTGRGIDLAFVSNERLAKQPSGVSALHVAPELAIEIMSPSNEWDGVHKKISEYFEIGVAQVWIVGVAVRMVTVFTSLTDSKGFLLSKGESLSCPEILPGFELPLSQIFEGLPPLEEDKQV